MPQRLARDGSWPACPDSLNTCSIHPAAESLAIVAADGPESSADKLEQWQTQEEEEEEEEEEGEEEEEQEQEDQEES